jgi:hypothetical protein
MPRFTFTSVRPGRIKPILVVASFFLLVAVVLTTKPHFAAVNTVSAAAPDETVAVATPLVAARLESEHITIRPTGFEPSEIKRPAGRVLLSVNDRSGLDSLDLRVDAERLHRLFEVRVPQDTKGRREWRQVIVLVPGHYVLTEAGHPDWSCRITITTN